MNAPGRGLLKTVSILFIIFGAIAAIISIAAVAGSAALASLGGAVTGTIGGVLMAAMIIMLFVSLLELILGIVGLKRCDNPRQAGYFIVTGYILCLLALTAFIIGIVGSGFQLTSFIGFILPILYIVGGYMNRRALDTPHRAH